MEYGYASLKRPRLRKASAAEQDYGRADLAEVARESPLRSAAHQRPQRHQGSDGNVLVIHQLFLREGQRFHQGSCLLLGLRLDHEDDAFAIAPRIPLADFPVE